ncbi:MAG: BamA/TamA family outer membrane protein [Bacteroidota bacterium]
MPKFYTKRLHIFGLLLGILCLSACNVTKHLDQAKGERLLVKNTLELKTDKRLNFGARAPIQYELASFFKQQPNKRSFFIFYTRLWMYYRYKDRHSRFSKWVMKKVAEPPVIYSPTLTSRTALNLENQMHQRGYLHAKCTYAADTIGLHKMQVKYVLSLKELYQIRDVKFKSKDSLVLQILQMTAPESHLKKGAPLDGRTFDAEKLRITSELKNRGYAYFTPNFVEFTGDTSTYVCDVSVRVLTPSDSIMHKVYTLGDIAVFYSLVPDLTSIRADTSINGIYFASSEPSFSLKPERLLKALTIQTSWPYRQVDFDKTARNLNALGVFKFVSIKPIQDSLQPELINVGISFTPNKRYSVGTDVEFNYRNSVAGGLIGTSSSVSFRNRNVFKGAELQQTNIAYNLEFDVTNKNRLIYSQEFKVQNELVLPRFFDYFGFWNGMHALHIGPKRLVGSTLYEHMRTEGRSRIALNYNYVNQTDFFRYHLFNASFGYDIQSGSERQYNFNHIGIDVLRPRFDPAFAPRVSAFLRRSFDDQLFTGFILRSFSYAYLSNINRFGERWQLRLNSEMSGLEMEGLNALWSKAFGPQTWNIGGLDFAKFIRLDLDVVYSREFRKDVVGAIRMGVGAVSPFGDSRAAPYVKQFFVGGPSSLRAWRIRELGPGAYVDTTPSAIRVKQPFYQAGDFRFEFNGELRFPMFLWLKGAVFLDGGNVWTLRPDAGRPGSQLRLDSYKNIAIGTGLGIRADFSYFIIRFDIGLKLKKPNAGDGSYWVSAPWRLRKENLAYNLAVGYPF